eukprot:667042-Amorphochlora_amoeboformis.AAC.1
MRSIIPMTSRLSFYVLRGPMSTSCRVSRDFIIVGTSVVAQLGVLAGSLEGAKGRVQADSRRRERGEEH